MPRAPHPASFDPFRRRFKRFPARSPFRNRSSPDGLPGAEPRLAAKLQRLLPNSAALISSPSAVLADHPSTFRASRCSREFRPRESHGSPGPLLTPKGVRKLAPLAYVVKPNSGSFGQVYVQATPLPVPESLEPITPKANVQPAGRAVAPSISNTLSPLALSVMPRPAAAGVPAGEVSIPVDAVLQPLHPAAKLQPAGTIQAPHIPVIPFGLAQSAPPSPRTSGDFQRHSGESPKSRRAPNGNRADLFRRTQHSRARSSRAVGLQRAA